MDGKSAWMAIVPSAWPVSAVVSKKTSNTEIIEKKSRDIPVQYRVGRIIHFVLEEYIVFIDTERESLFPKREKAEESSRHLCQ